MTTPSTSSDLDSERMRSVLAGPLGCSPDELDIAIITGGRSNLTFRLSAGDQSWILRRPPLGHVLATAHDMLREHRVMTALAAVDVPVPRTIYAEANPSVLGCPFYIMEFVDGLVVRSAEDARKLTPDQAARAADDLVVQLAHLHEVDYVRAGLADLGRPEGYLRRQIGRWRTQWHTSSTDTDTAAVEKLADELAAAVPACSAASLVHGDYRLDNTILSVADPGQIAVIIDWEMATLGDPLTDVGLMLAYWTPVAARLTGAAPITSVNQGFPSARALSDRYASLTGRSLERLNFYLAFAYFKLGVIAQTINARYLQGLTLGPDFDGPGEVVHELIDTGRQVLASADGSF